MAYSLLYVPEPMAMQNFKSRFALLLLATLLANTALAESKAKYCKEITSLEGRQERINRVLDFQVDPAITGGIMDAGLCWWKSRLNRSALYLTRYSPEKAKPTRGEAEKILENLVSFSHTVEIPGFKSFHEFTQEYPDLVKEALEAWQIHDAIPGAMRTLNPLRPTFYLKNKNQFRDVAIMERMLNQYGSLPYVLVQIKGLTAHSWLIKKIAPVLSKNIFTGKPYISAYKMTIIDVNERSEVIATVKQGDKTVSRFYINNPSSDHLTDLELTEKYKRTIGQSPIYSDFLVDLVKISKTINSGCARFPDIDLYPKYENWGTYR